MRKIIVYVFLFFAPVINNARVVENIVVSVAPIDSYLCNSNLLN